MELLNNIDISDLLSIENNPILEKIIVGNEDLEISALIKELGNSDWVKQGKDRYTKDNTCPFCQQKLQNEFEKILNQYFDDKFQNDISSLKILKSDYQRKSNKLLEYIKNLNNKFLDEMFLNNLYIVLDKTIKDNINKIEEKLKNPSIKRKLDTIEDSINYLNGLIEGANTKIIENNNIIKDKKAKQAELKNDLFDFLVNENKKYISEKIENIESLYNNNELIENEIKELNIENTIKENEIKELKQGLTSVEPTINKINELLVGFNFTNFKLALADDNRYKIVRQNGEDVQDTLSEGEKTFITILYFYFLLDGGLESTSVQRDKVVVFDDPVSSLDSNVLYIVSTLLREIIFKVKQENSYYIKQIFILTHNVYFHKEVVYNVAKRNKVLFYILNKNNNTTAINESETNTIKTSYQLLWQEYQEIIGSQNLSLETLQNVLRRIIENYFRQFGEEKDIKEKLYTCFSNENEKRICKAFFSWANDGSHYINDNLYIINSNDTKDIYSNIFEKIFELSGHKGHYNMMMGIDD